MSFSRSQQGLFRPMVARAWAKHAAGSDLDPSDKVAQDIWYRAELQECLGHTSTKDADPGRDFETVMAHFEVFVGGEFYWNRRIHQGDCRRLQFAIRQICDRWEIDDQYACATAVRVLKWEGCLDSLAAITKAADLQHVLIALLGAVHELKKMDKRSIFEPKMGSLREGELLFALPKGVILGPKAAFRHF
jgi:hypothetical protein